MIPAPAGGSTQSGELLLRPCGSYQHVDGLSAEQLRKSLDGIPSALSGLRSPMGESSRSECLAGMDMLNDMFQRQARRLESQLYQRAQDQRTIELTQQQAQSAMSQVRALEEHHVLQAARLSQAQKSLAQLQQHMRCIAQEHDRTLQTAEALQADCHHLMGALQRENPRALEHLQLNSRAYPNVADLRNKGAELAASMLETERSALMQIGATPTTAIAMSSDCNPLHDLSAVADYATPAGTGPHSMAGAQHYGY
mmetsp:Transcript_23666/g.51007  ORF Transcript_23666/g.51007 Transcript_23666/m.51007 type:complete len:254 (-) Transcript_23666:221-982(-)|eukprot:CAMPEP_0183336746 /NCGR_PEP_ID=MMETSP0164_2-20130417/4626_1 /TAXON_ID=221442 /ORGANISM="Coccolithus pelagicus ssp braarudi, Strain PLY182g" /LENGTH=253 /DNA_ID=CAMNT_0025506331 /DNA_START=72 /DNA_END=833 /DNA_ORIENTATION=+